ncbi:hypothetical protein DFH08DRAFT_818360 [Mycena albidolilacea]|uniref:Uncharacterized protein n=1 Tax=Mycena albidolilacea TaxID=1033008 RepID=A0AAD7EGB6_9AGAR|nr:hypothetical protein DFH08DRAFT_818360 [Mycena albidolilacea]
MGIFSLSHAPLYSKGGGKNGKHNNIDEHVNIGGISYLGTQVYEHLNGCQFRAITEVTASLQTKQFRFLPPFTFLYQLSATPKLTITGLELVAVDLALFQELSKTIGAFDKAVKKSTARKGRQKRGARRIRPKTFEVKNIISGHTYSCPQ